MADRDDENYFSDNDGFDALPVSTLQELEQYALTSTQHEPAIRIKQQYQTAQNASRVAREDPAWQNQQPVSAAGQHPFQEPPSSDYGLDDEDVIDLDEPSMVIEPASGPPRRVTIDVEAPYFHSQTEAGAQYYSTQPHHDAPFAKAGPQLDVSDLQARVEEVSFSIVTRSHSHIDYNLYSSSASGLPLRDRYGPQSLRRPPKPARYL